ncbi:MAG TPA: tetratricopeptide repeat protein [bacterium]|nr:tetratricopeptide repeat protein [bacterium]
MPIQPPTRLKATVLQPWTLTWVGTGVLLVLLSLKKIGSYDLGFHLTIGEWIWRNRQIPHQDLWTQMGGDYLDPHSLFQVLLFLFHQWGGFPLVSIVLTLLLLGIFGLLGSRLRATQAPSGIRWLLFLLALLMTERRFIPRPEVASWLFLSWNLWVLGNPRQDRRWAWSLALTQWLWTWTEGLFILGFLIQALFWIGGRLDQKKWDPILGKVLGLGFLLSFLNPNGWKGLLFPLTLWQRFQDPLYQGSISEFLPPLKVLATQNLHYDSQLHVWLFLVLSLACLAGFLWTWSRRTATEFLLLIPFLFLGWTSVRNIPLFTWVAIPLLARIYRDLEPRPVGHWVRHHGAPWVAVLITLFLGFRVMTDAFYVKDRRLDRFGIGLDPERLPLAAANFLKKEKLNGEMLNSLDWGGWLSWEGAGQPFIDGRLEVPSRDRFADYLQSFRSGGLEPFLEKVRPDLLVMEYNTARPWVQQLMAMPDWRLVYFDENSAIYLRKDYAPQVPRLDMSLWLSARRLAPIPEAELSEQVRSTIPSGPFARKEYPIGLGSEGLFALSLGEYPASQALFARQLRIAGGGFEEIFYNLGITCLHLKQWGTGRACLEKVLQLDPGNAEALRMLGQLP